ncbi:MAG TPA: glycoside hydrolase family 15 protein [Bryobacteraceae bacterium]|nr:glycoside hydrolase family 15 protein [Bryobacteraceae bacterium]
MPYKRIGSYGVIGDMHSVALVNMDGSIDWCCLPVFDSPSVFAAILDQNKGGFFRIHSLPEDRLRQMYLPETNILLTRFLSPEGVGEIVDFMPVRDAEHRRHSDGQIIRIVKGVRGAMRFRAACFPAFDYARAPHRIEIDDNVATFRSGPVSMALISPVPLRCEGDGVVADFVLEPNQTATFVVHWMGGNGRWVPGNLEAYGQSELQECITMWKRWVAKGQYTGRWREMVTRSALALKLLTYEPTGAIVAAPTTSLPEEIGGVRNWDYRYTWIRDAAFTIYSLLRLGYTDEASNFMSWIEARATEADTDIGPLQIMYGIDGRAQLDEFTLDHLEGYMGSKPARVGNAASQQLQLDVYGELIDSVYLYNKYAAPISWELWKYLRRMLYWVCDNWERPDHGIWEVRKEPEHFVYSKVQCWVALNRGLRIATKRGLPINFIKVREEASRIYETVMDRGFDKKRNTFVQYFGSEAIDAVSLMLPLMLFVSPTDPKMVGTIDRIQQELVSDSLVHRYELGKAVGDGLPGMEGTFSICSFWLVEVLARSGRLDEARFLFEKMLTYSNHLGLYAEEVGPTGEALGNFPQAFTHLGLISAAFDLDRRLG